jgi:hypothetical protein
MISRMYSRISMKAITVAASDSTIVKCIANTNETFDAVSLFTLTWNKTPFLSTWEIKECDNFVDKILLKLDAL